MKLLCLNSKDKNHCHECGVEITSCKSGEINCFYKDDYGALPVTTRYYFSFCRKCAESKRYETRYTDTLRKIIKDKTN